MMFHSIFKSESVWRAVGVLLLGVAVWMVYGRAVDSPFIFDDPASIDENPSILRLWPLVGSAGQPGPLNPPRDLPTSGRPLVNWTLAVNYHFGAFEPRGYHQVNFALNALCAMLLFALTRRTLELDFFQGISNTAATVIAWLGALLWTLHPLVSEPVIYVTQRTELMMALFYLATLYASLRYWTAQTTNGRRIWLSLAILACFAGMACKETMVSAPLVVLLFERVFISSTLRQAFRKSWPLYLGLALSWGLLLYLNYDAPRGKSAGFHLGLSPWTWWMTQCQVFWTVYLKLVVWPWPLSIQYETPYLKTLGEAWPWVLATGLLVLAVSVALWKNRPAGFVGAAVLLILAPTLVVPILTEIAAERRMYLPLAFLVPAVVFGIYRLLSKFRWLMIAGSLTAVGLAILFGIVTTWRLAAFHDPLTLWQDTVDHQPQNSRARSILGISLLKADQVERAFEELKESLRLNPDSADDHVNYGNALMRTGHPQEALDQWRAALQIDPDSVEALNNVGTVLQEAGHLDEARKYHEHALELKPESAEVHNNLANTLHKQGHWPDALAHYQRTGTEARLHRSEFQPGRGRAANESHRRGFRARRKSIETGESRRKNAAGRENRSLAVGE